MTSKQVRWPTSGMHVAFEMAVLTINPKIISNVKNWKISKSLKMGGTDTVLS